MTEEKNNEHLWKAFIFLLGLLSSIAISLATWTATGVIKNANTISGISSSRCTSADCSHIRESISDLRAQISVLPKEVPPKWFLDKVNTIEQWTKQELITIERRLDAIERTLYTPSKPKQEVKFK